MRSFDAQTTLANLHSSEAEVVEGSIIVTSVPEDFLAGLVTVFVRFN